MKNIATILILIVTTLGLTSCEKPDPTFCYECSVLSLTTTKISGGNSNTKEVKSKVNYCDKTEEDINEIQTSGNTDVTSFYGNVTVKITTRTTCFKK